MKTLNKKFYKELENELKMARAKSREIPEFISIADRLSEFSKIERSFAVKRRFLQGQTAGKRFILPFLPSLNWFIPKWALAPAISFVLIILIGTGSVLAAQRSLPGEPLYKVKRLSETVVSSVKPEFRNEMLIRRSEEIRGLVERKKSSKFLDQAITEYKKEKGKTRHDSWVILKAEDNVEKAKEKATDEFKKELEKLEFKKEIKNGDEGTEIKIEEKTESEGKEFSNSDSSDSENFGSDSGKDGD